ncbi:MAG: hypothetical protein F6J93_08255 [Oscillatoria sp. SIO1A7]|nr:hypothetical protein [Oscillatoria sp. SIO1A7]
MNQIPIYIVPPSYYLLFFRTCQRSHSLRFCDRFPVGLRSRSQAYRNLNQAMTYMKSWPIDK